jgi:hypothetical protein
MAEPSTPAASLPPLPCVVAAPTGRAIDPHLAKTRTSLAGPCVRVRASLRSDAAGVAAYVPEAAAR